MPVEGVVDYCTEEVANHTVGLILAWNRKILDYHDAVVNKEWKRTRINYRYVVMVLWPCFAPFCQNLALVGFGLSGQERCDGPHAAPDAGQTVPSISTAKGPIDGSTSDP